MMTGRAAGLGSLLSSDKIFLLVSRELHDPMQKLNNVKYKHNPQTDKTLDSIDQFVDR